MKRINKTLLSTWIISKVESRKATKDFKNNPEKYYMNWLKEHLRIDCIVEKIGDAMTYKEIGFTEHAMISFSETLYSKMGVYPCIRDRYSFNKIWNNLYYVKLNVANMEVRETFPYLYSLMLWNPNFKIKKYIK